MAHRIGGAEVGQPAVVDPAAGADELEVTGGRQEHHEGAPRERLFVLAAVEDDLGRHAVVVEVAPPGHGIVVACGATVAPLRRVGTAGHLGVHRGTVRVDARRELVERGEQRRLAVRSQVVAQARPDVGVARDDDDRRGGAGGIGRSGHGPLPPSVD